MAELSKKYQDIINELEKNIKDSNELNRIKGQLSELVIYFTDAISKSAEMESNLIKLDKNLRKLQRRIDYIEDDIYIDSNEELDQLDELGSDQMHDHDYEFEITCPYCDYEFITDSSYKYEKTIICPKCNKTIELDWNIDEPCSENCNSCSSHCNYKDEEKEENNIKTNKEVAEDEEKYSVDVKPPKKDEKNNRSKEEKKDNNDDDM